MTIIDYVMWYLLCTATFFVGYRLFVWAYEKGSTDNYPAPDEPEVLTTETVAAWREELHVVERRMLINGLVWLFPAATGVAIMIMGTVGMLFPIITDFEVRFV